MVCIEKRPYTLYGRLATLHFRYLTCLLDRGHINGKIGESPYFFILDCRKVGMTSSFSFFSDLAKRLFMSEALMVL